MISMNGNFVLFGEDVGARYYCSEKSIGGRVGLFAATNVRGRVVGEQC